MCHPPSQSLRSCDEVGAPDSSSSVQSPLPIWVTRVQRKETSQHLMNMAHRFFARASRSESPVGASVSAPVVSSSIICRLRIYARTTAASRTISVAHFPSMKRLMRKTRRPPSGPTLTSRSRSIDDARLNPGDAATAGPPVRAMVGEYARLSLRARR
jgi:hypothetical protein